VCEASEVSNKLTELSFFKEQKSNNHRFWPTIFFIPKNQFYLEFYNLAAKDRNRNLIKIKNRRRFF